MVSSLKNYKLAKVFVKDIEIILKQFDGMITTLTPFGKYKAVSNVLKEIKDNRAVLQSHKIKCDQIITTKGELKNE